MLPLSALAPERARGISGVLFDLDDTLLDHGALSQGALGALFQLRGAGLHVVGVTGRPASWGEVLARLWPVNALVTENGGVSYVNRAGRVAAFDRLTPAARATRRALLEQKAKQVQEAFPALARTDDAPGRRSDTTFDIGEYGQVPAGMVRSAMAYARTLGLRVTRSSVHLHVSLDGDDKCSGVLRLLEAEFGVDPGAARYRYAYIGDSGNDAPCFAYFDVSVGVRNVSGSFSLPPAFVTPGERSDGFCQFVGQLLAAR